MVQGQPLPLVLEAVPDGFALVAGSGNLGRDRIGLGTGGDCVRSQAKREGIDVCEPPDAEGERAGTSSSLSPVKSTTSCKGRRGLNSDECERALQVVNRIKYSKRTFNNFPVELYILSLDLK